MIRYYFSHHFFEQIRKRRIPLFWVKKTLRKPEQILKHGYNMRKIFQSKIKQANGKTYLLRVIVLENLLQPVVETAYLTSKVEKYWRPG